MSELSCFVRPDGQLKQDIFAFLAGHGIRPENDMEYTALITSGGKITGTGSLCGNVLKYIAVDEDTQGEGACARIVSELAAEAFARGRSHLFLCTSPKAAPLFKSLGFFDVIATAEMALLENRRGGLSAYLAGLSRGSGRQGAVVANCAPFTLGHRHLVETALGQVDTLHLFVVSQGGGPFPPRLRYEMVERGTSGLPGVLLHECGDYLISAATFPAYFIKDSARAEVAQAELDIALFTQRIAPELGICIRFVGEEPFCPVTARYNQRLKQALPEQGIELVEIPRLGGISASRVRQALEQGDWETVKQLTPNSTYELLRSNA